MPHRLDGDLWNLVPKFDLTKAPRLLDEDNTRNIKAGRQDILAAWVVLFVIAGLFLLWSGGPPHRGTANLAQQTSAIDMREPVSAFYQGPLQIQRRCPPGDPVRRCHDEAPTMSRIVR
jgi:hypothetical protein